MVSGEMDEHNTSWKSKNETNDTLTDDVQEQIGQAHGCSRYQAGSTAYRTLAVVIVIAAAGRACCAYETSTAAEEEGGAFRADAPIALVQAPRYEGDPCPLRASDCH